MQIVILRVEDKDVPKLERALRASGIAISPVNDSGFERLPFTFAATTAERIEHREAQCEMFGACKNAGLDINNREAMIAAINFFLGLKLTSRTQMTPAEMRAVTHAAASGFWRAGWVARRAD